MKEPSSQRQLFVWAGIAVAALIGVAVIVFLVGLVSGAVGQAAATPTALPPSPTPIVVTIAGIKAQAELSTVEYTTVAEVYRENVPEGWLDDLLGTREKLLMLVYGDVRAGFDLEGLTEENLWTDGKRVRLVLPAPKILNSSIDFDQTHIVYYENNLIIEDNNPNLEGEALQEAKKAIEEAALRQGILDKANQYGKVYFENLLYSLGFEEVEVVVDAQIFKE